MRAACRAFLRNAKCDNPSASDTDADYNLKGGKRVAFDGQRKGDALAVEALARKRLLPQLATRAARYATKHTMVMLSLFASASLPP